MSKKRLLIIVIPLVVSLVIFCLFFLFQVPLISPLADTVDNSVILNQKISVKVTSGLQLDYSASSTLPALEKIPHYLVYNSENGKVYAGKGHTDSVSPASFTKLMTAQVAIDLSLPNQPFLVSILATQKEPTTLGLKPGEQLFLTDLLRAVIATSANDAAAVIAENSIKPYGGKLDTFIEQMNKKAVLLEMKNTGYANPEGYDDQKQYSTLEDQVKLINNAQQNYPDILYAGKSDREDILKSPTHGKYYLTNWNGLLGVYPGVDGLKIAYTENAGYSTIVTAVRHDVHIVAILTGAGSIPERDLAAAALLDAAFMAEKIAPVNLTKRHLQPRYDVWNRLIRQTRRELEALKNI